MMTYVHLVTTAGSRTRIQFDPERMVYDHRTKRDIPLYELYVRDCNEQPGENWIEDPDGGYAYPPKSVREAA